MSTSGSKRQRVLVLKGSPRTNGNSAALADAFAAGAESAGCEVAIARLDEHIGGFLRDCRQCRRADGSCGIADGYASLFLDQFLPAQAVAFATPIYWYGTSAQMKAFFDRTFCYYAASHPRSAENIRGMMHKRLALLLSSEETYPGATLGVIHQLQEYARYTHSELVGVVHGRGNRRGEVGRDPDDPLQRARRLGERLFTAQYSDYRIDTVRGGAVWPAPTE